MNKIMVVEDELIVAEDYKRCLQFLGYEVSAIVSSGEDAVKQVKENPPHLILMDIKLKGEMNGIEAAHLIHSDFDIPIVFVTGYADDTTLQEMIQSEPYGFIFKPFQYKELHGVIETALYKHKMEKQLKEKEAWLFTTLQSIGDAVITTDKTGKISFMNPMAEKLTGWNLPEVKDKLLEEVLIMVNEDTGESVKIPFNRVLKEGSVVSVANNVSIINKKKKKIPIDDSGSPIKDGKGNISGMVLIFRDVTQRRKPEIRGNIFYTYPSDEKSRHLNMILSKIRSIHTKCIKEKNMRKMIQMICSTLMESHCYHSVWIALWDEHHNFTFITGQGQSKNFQYFKKLLGKGALPTCAEKSLSHEGITVIENPSSDCPFCPLAADCSDVGAMTTRLEFNGTVYGLFSVSTSVYLIKDKEEQCLFKELAEDIAFTIYKMESKKQLQQRASMNEKAKTMM
ncbi:MAG: response regulator [bacterium]